MAAAIPCRDVVLAVGADDPAKAYGLSKVASQQFGKQSYAISPEFFLFMDGNDGKPVEGGVKAS